MKNFFCLLVVVAGLMSGQSSLAQAPPPVMPPLPPPPPPAFPNCPAQLMGQVNGIYYWLTQNCPANGSSGFDQSTVQYTPPCCKMSSGAWVCDCGTPTVPIPLPMPEPPAPLQQQAQPDALQQAPPQAVQKQVVIAIASSPACDLPQGTAAETATKLTAIIQECQTQEAYLQKLMKSSEVQNSEPGNQKKRIETWLPTVTAMVNYLQNGSDSAEVKIGNYCSQFLPNDLKHQQAWRHATFPLGNGKTQQISNEKQKGPLLAATDVDFAREPNVTPVRGPIVRVNTSNLPTPEKKIYFQTFKVFFAPTGSPESSFYIGVQVLEPAPGVAKNAIFIDRHNFGHKIRIPPTGETFLVSSEDDLGIAK